MRIEVFEVEEGRRWRFSCSAEEAEQVVYALEQRADFLEEWRDRASKRHDKRDFGVIGCKEHAKHVESLTRKAELAREMNELADEQLGKERENARNDGN